MANRKKAIERAMAAGWEEYDEGNHGAMYDAMNACVSVASGLAYDEGRIAGLREAARLWICTPESCREQANALAKKARKRDAK